MPFAVAPPTEGFAAERALEGLQLEMRAYVIAHLRSLLDLEIIAEKTEQKLPLAVCVGI